MNWSIEADGSVLVGYGSNYNRTWSEIEDNPHNNIKIAGFDFDDTILHYYRKIKNIERPWVYISDEFIKQLKKFLIEGYMIVVWTNQSTLEKKESEWKTLVDELYLDLTHELEKRFQFIVMAAMKNDIYRKPNLGMYNMIIKKFGKKVDKIFYCGDAAGRRERSYYRIKFYPTGKSSDFSDSDYKFALNIPKCTFLTPEKMYLKEPLKAEIRGFNPFVFLEEHPPEKYVIKHRKKELIIMVGYPSVGKTWIANKYFDGYKIFSKDDYKKIDKYERDIEAALDNEESVVIANTSPDVASRVRWTARAKKIGYTNIRCLIIGTSIELAYHLNNVRMLYEKTIKFDMVVYYKFRKSLVKPSKDEGFDKIEMIRWRIDPDLFEDKKWHKAFFTYSEGIKVAQ